MIVPQIAAHATHAPTPEEKKSDLVTCGCSTLLVLTSLVTRIYSAAPVQTFFFGIGGFSGAVLAQNLLRHYTIFRLFKEGCATVCDRTHMVRGLLLVIAMVVSKVFPTLGLVLAAGVGGLAGLAVRM